MEKVRRASDLVYGCADSGHEEGAGDFLDPSSMVVLEISLGPQRRRQPLCFNMVQKKNRVWDKLKPVLFLSGES